MLGISLFSFANILGKDRTQPKMPPSPKEKELTISSGREGDPRPPLALKQFKSKKLLPSLDGGGEERRGEGGGGGRGV